MLNVKSDIAISYIGVTVNQIDPASISTTMKRYCRPQGEYHVTTQLVTKFIHLVYAPKKTISFTPFSGIWPCGLGLTFTYSID
jgi:hypothetical protein